MVAYDVNSKSAEPSPDQQILSATERFQQALAELAKAAVKADTDRREAALSAAALDDAHHGVDAARQEFNTTLDRLGLVANYPQAVEPRIMRP